MDDTVWFQIVVLFGQFFRYSVFFLVFTVFTSIMYFFFAISFQTPLKNEKMYITRQCVTTHVENGWVLGDLGKLWSIMRVYFWAWKKWKIYTENIKLKAIKYRNDWHCHSLRSYRSKNWHVSIFSLVPQSEKLDCELWKMFEISLLTGGASPIVFNVKSSV